MKGFAFPRRFKSAASLLPTLTRNNRELLNFLNSYVVRFQSDASSVVLPGTLSVAGDVSIAGDLSGLDWQAWTPTYANLTLGNGTVTARYVLIGDTVHAYYHLLFGSTTTIDGTAPTISMPVTAASHYSTTDHLGVARLHENGGSGYPGSARYASTTTFTVDAHRADGTYLTATSISATIPFTWGTNDVLAFLTTYEAA